MNDAPATLNVTLKCLSAFWLFSALLSNPNSAFAQEAPVKIPEPTRAEQDRAATDIKNLFKDEYKKAAAADRLALAKKLFQLGSESKDDSVARFVLFQEASELAAGVGDASLSLRAVDELNRWYEFDALRMKATVLMKAVGTAKSPSAFKTIATVGLGLVDDALDADNCEFAKRMLVVASDAAGKAHDGIIVKECNSRRADLEDLEKLIQEANKAAGILREKPGDGDANRIVGRYLCLAKDDWKTGLPMLLVCSELGLKEIADAELSEPNEPGEQVKLADGWWLLSEAEEGFMKRRTRQRALYWYQQALTQLTGITKARVDARLKEAASSGTGFETIDLLKLINPQVDAVHGGWKFVGQTLLTPDLSVARLQLPYTPPREYFLKMVIEADVARPQRGTEFVIGLIVDRFRTQVVVDARRHVVECHLEADPVKAAEYKNHKGPILAPNTIQTVTCLVLRNRLVVHVDGKVVISWKGNSRDLRANPPWETPNNTTLYVGADARVFRISKIELTPISGRGKPLR